MKDYKLKLRKLQVSHTLGCDNPVSLGVPVLRTTRLSVELEHLKIETRLTIEKFSSAMGEYVTER
jgi:hypothetical protein